MDNEIYQEDVCNRLIEWIKEKVPTYRFNDHNIAILKYGFEACQTDYTKDEANKVIFSITDKIKNKNPNGRLTPVERAIFSCRDRLWKHKGSASLGAGEYWTSLIMNWDFSKDKGVDLIDEKGLGVDIKAVTSSVGKIPCTFFDNCDNPILKEHGKIKYLGNIVWQKGWSFKGMYRAMDNIAYCQIPYVHLDRYIFYKFDVFNNMLISVEKDKYTVEDEINSQLRNGVDTKKIDLTHSLWEDGSYIFTFEEFGAI